MSTPRLSDTSYVVLGMLDQIGPATPYELKRMAQLSTINFWNVPHTQLYSESARLAKEGLLEEVREQTGRRRRTYSLTDRGRAALEAWRSEPTDQLDEVRDVSTVKLFFGGDPAKLAAAQLEAHRRQLRSCERMLEEVRTEQSDPPPGWALALEAGIGHEREFIRFWSRMAKRPQG